MSDGEERERSDLFSLRRPAAPKESIPPVAEVLTPPEELRKERLQKAAVAVVAALLVTATAYTIHHFVHRAAVETAALRAGDTGRAADVRAALDALGASEHPGLRARLQAMLALAGELPLGEAQAALDAVPADDEAEASERLKAQTYLAAARGDAPSALAAASALIPVGTFAAETAHARSLAAFMSGDLAAAVTEARGATSIEEHARAPRYVAQLALALELAGERAQALAVLETADAPASPAVRIVRARIAARARQPEARDEAQATLAAADALAAERAWAHLVVADGLAAAGAREAARAEAAEARRTPPPGDALFRWRLAEVLLRADAADAAAEVVDGLEGPVPDVAVAGRVRAWLALHAGDLPTAAQILDAAGGSPPTWLLAGLLHERRGALDEARGYYDRVAADPAFAVEGLTARARLELEAGDAEEAARLAGRALERAPHHPAVVPVAVSAALAGGRKAEARELAEAAHQEHPEDLRVLTALVDARLAVGDFAAALEAVRAALERAPSDPDLEAKRGEAARGGGDRAQAREAYLAALRSRRDHPVALVGLLHLDLDEGNLEHAKEMIDALEGAGVDTDEVVRLRVRFLVASAAGVSGTRYVLRATRRRGLRRDPSLRRALAELYLQGELYRPAAGMFQQAARLGEDRAEMLLGVAMAHARDGKTNIANDTLAQAAEAPMGEAAPEGASSPIAEHPRFLAVRARMELNLGHFAAARRFAERALAVDPGQSEAHLVLGEVAQRQRRNPTEHWLAALRPPYPQPLAAALLARRHGADEEGCRYAQQYVRAASRRATHYDGMVGLLERCGH